jgi:beta-galactosidase
LTEYRKAIEPVQVLLEESTYQTITIINRYDCVTLDHLACHFSIGGDSGIHTCRWTVKDASNTSGREINLPRGIKPGAKAILTITDAEVINSVFLISDLPSVFYINLTFTLKDSTNWAPAGFEVAFGQVPIIKKACPSPLSYHVSSEKLSYTQIKQVSQSHLEITSGGTKWTFNRTLGTLVSWLKGPHELLASPPILSFYRAVTDNDRPQDGNDWLNARLHQARSHFISFETKIDQSNGTVTLIVESRIAPPVFEWSIDTTTTYMFQNNSVKVHVKGKPRGLRLPPTLSRIGLEFSLSKEITRASWFGRGPGESYCDTKLSQRFGNWEADIKQLYTPYEWPQESGNRTDIRWVEFRSPSKYQPSTSQALMLQMEDIEEGSFGLKAHFGSREGCSFTAIHYTTADLDECTHAYELEKRRTEEVQVRLDWRHHGIGSGSCGPRTYEQYALKTEEFEAEVLLQ